jgi:hypothetical protein
MSAIGSATAPCELACQIFDECRRLCYRTMLRPCVVYGGASTRGQREQLEMGLIATRGCVVYGGAPTRGQREQLEMKYDIFIASSGRLMDFVSNTNQPSLTNAATLPTGGISPTFDRPPRNPAENFEDHFLSLCIQSGHHIPFLPPLVNS